MAQVRRGKDGTHGTIQAKAPAVPEAEGRVGCACGDDCHCGSLRLDTVRRSATYLEDDDVIMMVTQIFDALSDYTRFMILGALTASELSVSELQEICSVSQSAISHQLRLLRDRGLVSTRRDGQRIRYSLADDHVRTLIEVGLEHAAHLKGGE